ncbi:MAG: hypothetical protein CMJ48_09125 [Planctomycetaceae bacterium]|nr:hypothetical protein [Planctomycetaceae bacterium]
MKSYRATIPAVAFIFLLGLTLAGDQCCLAAEEGATVAGVVKFDGPRPKRKKIRLVEKGGKQSDCHKLHEKGLLDESMIVGEKGEVANVFVYVRKGLAKKSYPLPKEPAVLDQQKCMFRPRVQGVRVGQEFVMRNSDPLIHNVRSLSFRNRPFNIAQPAETPDRKKVFTRAEKAVMIQCDLHHWMQAYYFVMEHPYFAVTDAKGKFKIKGLPPGEYTLEAWHEAFGKKELKLTVADADSSNVNFAFTEKDREKASTR